MSIQLNGQNLTDNNALQVPNQNFGIKIQSMGHKADTKNFTTLSVIAEPSEEVPENSY